jgi:hypothetical protein
MRKIVYFVIIVGVLLGCGERQEYREALSRAEAVMNDHPDSALMILDAMNTEKKSWSKSLRMRFELMKAKAQNKAFVKFTSDSVMKDVVAYYDGWGESPNDRLLANYLLGCIYRDLNETSHAIDCFHDAITKADTTAGNCDYITLSRVYSQMAGMYHRQLLFSNEVDTRKLASYYASLANDSINAVFELGKIAGVYITLNKKDSAEILLKETINNCRRFGLTQDAILFSTSLMYLYIDQPEHLSDLKDLIDQYETETTLFDKHHNLPASKRIFFYYKGNYYENVNNLDTAEYYYRKIWRPDMSYASKVPMYKGLMNVYGKRHQTDSLFKYAQLYAEANDSSMISKDQQQTAQLSASYNYRHYKRLMLENERNAYKNGVIAIICLASLVITIMVGIYVSKKYREIQKKKRENIRNKYQQKLKDLQQLEETYKLAVADAQKALTILREEKNASQSECVKAQESIEKINKKYHQEKTLLTEEILVLKEKIEELKCRHKVQQDLLISKKLAETEILKKISVLAKAHRSMNSTDMSLLEEAFSQFYPILIYDLLQQGKFSQTEKTVCLLSALDYSPASICNLTKQSSSSVTNIRSKINMSLFNDKSASSLYKNLYKRYGICPT